VLWNDDDIMSSRQYGIDQIRSLRGGESCPGVFSDTMACKDVLDYVVVCNLLALLTPSNLDYLT